MLIIDEAQNLSLQVLEEIRLLTNLETSTEKLLQIVLTGQPELEEKLKLAAIAPASPANHAAMPHCAAHARRNVRIHRRAAAHRGSERRADFLEGSDSDRAHVFARDSPRGELACASTR